MPQPTCVLMQIVRRSRSRSSTHSIWPPSARPSSSFSVPSSACVCLATAVGPEAEPLGQLGAQRLGQVGHRLPVGGALLEQPLADLRGAKLGQAALGRPGGQRAVDRVEQVWLVVGHGS